MTKIGDFLQAATKEFTVGAGTVGATAAATLVVPSVVLSAPLIAVAAGFSAVVTVASRVLDAVASRIFDPNGKYYPVLKLCIVISAIALAVFGAPYALTSVGVVLSAKALIGIALAYGIARGGVEATAYGISKYQAVKKAKLEEANKSMITPIKEKLISLKDQLVSKINLEKIEKKMEPVLGKEHLRAKLLGLAVAGAFTLGILGYLSVSALRGTNQVIASTSTTTTTPTTTTSTTTTSTHNEVNTSSSTTQAEEFSRHDTSFFQRGIDNNRNVSSLNGLGSAPEDNFFGSILLHSLTKDIKIDPVTMLLGSSISGCVFLGAYFLGERNHQQEIETLTANLERTKEGAEEVGNHLLQVQSDLIQARQDLQDKVKENNEQYQISQRLVGHLREERAQLQAKSLENTTQAKANRQLDEAIKDLTKKIQKLEVKNAAEKRQLDSQIEQKESRIEDLEEELNKATQDAQKHKEHLHASRLSFSQVQQSQKQQIEKLQEQIVRVEIADQAKTEELKASQRMVAELEGKVRDLSKEVARVQEQNQAQQGVLEELQALKNSEIESSEARVSELTMEVQTLTATQKRLNTELQAKESQITETAEKLQTLETSIQKLETTLREKTSLIEEKETAIHMKEKQIAQLDGQVQSRKDQGLALAQANEMLRQLKDEVSKQREENAKLINERIEIQTNLSQAQSAVLSLQTQLRQEQGKSEELVGKQQSLLAQFSKVQVEKQSLQSQVRGKTAVENMKLGSEKENLASVEQKLQELQAAHQELQERYEGAIASYEEAVLSIEKMGEEIREEIVVSEEEELNLLIQSYQTILQASVSQKQEFDKKNADFQATFNKIMEEKAQTLSKARQLEQELNRIQSSQKEEELISTVSISQLKQREKELEEQLQQQTQIVELLNSQNRQLQESLFASAQSSPARATPKADLVTETLQSVNASSAERAAQGKALKGKVEELTQENGSLRTAIQTLQQRVQELQGLRAQQQEGADSSRSRSSSSASASASPQKKKGILGDLFGKKNQPKG